MEYYNKIANGYDELYEKEQLKKIKTIKKYIKPKGKILDIGAGTGIVSRLFDNVVSLDPSEKMLERVKGEKVIGKAEKLPFKNKSFDTIISLTALHHANPEKAVSEIKRVAKDNAQIAVTILKKSKKLEEYKILLKDFKQIEEEKDIIFIKSD